MDTVDIIATEGFSFYIIRPIEPVGKEDGAGFGIGALFT
jgi:hypothetical protein